MLYVNSMEEDKKSGSYCNCTTICFSSPTCIASAMWPGKKLNFIFLGCIQGKTMSVLIIYIEEQLLDYNSTIMTISCMFYFSVKQKSYTIMVHF